MITIAYLNRYREQAAKRIRIIEPLAFLAQLPDFHVISIEEIIAANPKNPDFSAVDVLYLFLTDVNHTTIHEMGPLLDLFLQKRKAVVTNLDDHYFMVPDNITVKREMEQNRPIFEQLVKVSRLVLVTGRELKTEISQYNPATVTVPNMIDPQAYPLRRGGNEKIHIGWCGLPSHFADLALILPAVKRVMRAFPVEFTIFGLFMENMQDTITTAQKSGLSDQEIKKHFPQGHFISDALNMAGQLAGIPYHHVPLVDYDKFPTILSQLNFDIGLCPLLDNLFNRCKSAIKFAQYAAVGTVTLAADVYPYAAECNFRAHNTVEDWYAKLSTLVEDESLRRSILTEQRSYVMENRNYQKAAALYETLFKKAAG